MFYLTTRPSVYVFVQAKSLFWRIIERNPIMVNRPNKAVKLHQIYVEGHTYLCR